MNAAGGRMRVIMDVDTGVDDAVALALAVRHPGIQLEAVSTVAGNVSLEQTTRNTLRVLDWLGATHVPVARGAAVGLSGPFKDASHWHGPDGLGGARLPESPREAIDDGVSYLLDRIHAEPPGTFVLVCTAPLTNLALAVEREPRLPSMVREVVLMGGAARAPGNVTPVAEFNIRADALAAARVFEQDWRVTMVGLDVTREVQITRADRDRLAQLSSPDAVLLREVTRFLFDTRGFDSMLVHDALAVAVGVDPSIVTMVERDVRVETRGEHTLGQTVVDLRTHAQGGTESGRTRVCMRVDVQRFRKLLFGTLGLELLLR
ncbi:MAG: nucleoside hydrolase [Chloroflexi bacterium]|nr:nucleoside hydrolase [Chloroflexota bacterium]